MVNVTLRKDKPFNMQINWILAVEITVPIQRPNVAAPFGNLIVL